MPDDTSDLVLASTKQARELERNREAVESLSVLARKLRLTSSRRSPLFVGVGLRPRRIDRVFRLLFAAAFVGVLLAPNAAAILYYGNIASDQYQSETRFTVESPTPAVEKDRLREVSGIPAAKIAQDTKIVANFLTSQRMLETLEDKADFTGRYANPVADFMARLDPSEPIEDRLNYWKHMAKATIDPQSGIVTVKVRAFSAADANAILTEVTAASEHLVNELNDRMWQDMSKSAQLQVQRSKDRLNEARAKLQEARNETGILTIESSSESLIGLLSKLEGERIELASRYRSNSQVVSTDAPQMKVIASQIANKERQIEDLKTQIASEQSSGATLANASTLFSQLGLNEQIAEKQLEASIKAVEQLRYASQRQLIYLEEFLSPTVSEAPEYPKRGMWISLVFLGSLIAFGSIVGLLAVLRKRLD